MNKERKESWKIVTQYVVDNEDQFMEYLESEHDICGSDMDILLQQVEKKIHGSVKIKSCGVDQSPNWGACNTCGETITIRANYCPGCGGVVLR